MFLLAAVGTHSFCRARFVALLVLYIAVINFPFCVRSIRSTIQVPSRNSKPFLRETKRHNFDRNSPYRSTDSRQASSGISISSRERNLDYIYHPNGRSVQFAPLQGQLFSPLGRHTNTVAAYGLTPAPVSALAVPTHSELLNPGESGESMVPSPGPVGCVHTGSSCAGWSASFAPGPSVIINRGPTSTFTNLNSRFAAFSANVPYQRTGKFSLLVQQASAGSAYRNKFPVVSFSTSSTTTPAPPAEATYTAQTSPARGILPESSGTLGSVTSTPPVRSPEDFQVILRTLFGW